MDFQVDILKFDSNRSLKSQQLDAIMAEAGRKRRKTRRGKKKSLKRDNNWNCDFDKKLAEESRRMQQMIRKAVKGGKTLRPCSSPKAPMNSTQFLIEDSGNDRLSFDMLSHASPYSSPDQIVMFDGINRLEDSSFYDDDDASKKSFGDDDEYIPMDMDEMTEFVEREFERDLQSLNFDLSSRIDEKRAYFKSTTQEEIVNEYMRLENELNKVQEASNKKSSRSGKMQKELEMLLQENVKLKEENCLLRSLLH